MDSPARSPSFRRLVLSIAAFLLLIPQAFSEERFSPPGGELKILAPDGRFAGACPLARTDVKVQVSGFIARVKVEQVFHNPLNASIEAVYVFPLPHDSAVDDMEMIVGDRRIEGRILRREEARKVYEEAKTAGRTAGLLDQERPNIFTQSVANIVPGAEVTIRIQYVEILKYEDGMFEFVFPMVVEPRYMPGQPVGKAGAGWALDTAQVPDASLISPPVASPGTRAGHDIHLTMDLHAGMPILDIESKLHDVEIVHPGMGRASVTLRKKDEIPNRDFILTYRLAGDGIEDAFLVHEDERGRFFTLLLQPPRRTAPAEVVPRELIFVLDVSGSMSGFPIEKAKETMAMALDGMRSFDTFNLITFSGGNRVLWEEPRPNTIENREAAQAFLAGQHGGGGTEMMAAIRAALQKTDSFQAYHPTRGPYEIPAGTPPVRIVCFMTDGCVGNDLAIIEAVKDHVDTTRVFSFGIGNSVNRFLIEGMAQAGRGHAEIVTLGADSDAAVKRFYERIESPVLTDIEIDWGGLPVDEVYPMHIPDLFIAGPVLIHGRLREHGRGLVTLRGFTGAGPIEKVRLVDTRAALGPHESLASLWARARVKLLLHQDLSALQTRCFPDELREAVIDLGLAYRLMTPFTSFVAVEERIVTQGGQPVKIAVPVDLPEGVSHEGIFGSARSGRGGFLFGPGNTAPPSNPGGPATPGFGSSLGPRGATTGGLGRKRTAGGEGFERWEFWWEHNKEAYLVLGNRSKVLRVAAGAGSAPASRRPSKEVVEKQLLPTLRKALTVDHPDILDAAVLALAKAAPPEQAQDVMEELVKVIGSKYQTARQSAVLSLGILGAPEAVGLLRDLMADSMAGKRRLGMANVPKLVRAFAAVSLGLINTPEAAEMLMAEIQRTSGSERDLEACAITALGLMRENEKRERIVDFLVELMDDEKMDPFIMASIPVALGRLGDPRALPAVVSAFTMSGQNNWIRQSCALAMGMLVTVENGEVLRILMDHVRDGRDDQTRHFSYIALGRIGARDRNPQDHGDIHEVISGFFQKEISTPQKITHLPWAALGGAVYAREQELHKGGIMDRISEAFRKNRNPSYQGALAVSLGLLDARSEAQTLLDEMNRTKDKALQGYLCLALGLMEYRPAMVRIRAIVETEVASFRLKVQAVLALGLMGDAEAVELLVRSLREGTTLSVTASAAKALGLLGDARAVVPLKALLEDSRANPLARAFAAVALGMIAERTELPWNHRIAAGGNYRAKVQAVCEILDIL